MVPLIIGAVLFVGGVVLIVVWWTQFVGVFLGSFPPILIICGLAAIAVGVSSIRDKMASAAREEETKPEEKKA